MSDPTDPGGPSGSLKAWSDPTTWPSGHVPVAGDSVVIPAGLSVELDSSPPALHSLTIDGTLVFGSRDFDLVTGFSLIPLQLFSMIGMAVSVLSALLVLLLFIRRLVLGPEAEGLFTLFGIVFFLIGIALFGIGLLGEYVGRMYLQVRARPRYLVQAVLESDAPALPAVTLEPQRLPAQVR